jgi:hypothetical protein
MRKTHLEKLGFGVGLDSTITGNFNLKMIQKNEPMKINWLMNLQRTSMAFMNTLKRIPNRPFKKSYAGYTTFFGIISGGLQGGLDPKKSNCD